jgi:multidrug efflux system membrane fusion protein
LFPNQFVNARLLVDTIKDTVLIPSAGVQRSPTETFVYAIKEKGNDSVVEMREVKIGPSEGEVTSIVSGLAAGEKVVTDGADKLQPGSKVSTGRPGGASRPASGPGATMHGGGEGKGQHGGGEGGHGGGGRQGKPGAAQ